jgi:hypothetical protein
VNRRSTWEAVVVDRSDQVEEVLSVDGVVLKVLRDHAQRALKHSAENGRNFVRHQPLVNAKTSESNVVPVQHDARGCHLTRWYLESVDDDAHERQDLGVPRVGDVVLVVDEHGLEKRRDEVVHEHLRPTRNKHRRRKREQKKKEANV